MPDELTVSVVIPTRNRPELLARALASVVQQTHPPHEIVVVDDASTVPYAEVLAQFAASPVPVRYERHDTSQGGGATRNDGARLATGDILMFLDDDDTWQPEKIAHQVAILAAQPEVGLVYAGRRVVNEAGELLYTVTPRKAGKLLRDLLQGNCIGTTSSVAMRREVFWEAGGFDPEMPARQDVDLWVRVARLTQVAFDPEPTVNYLVTSTAGTQITDNAAANEAAAARMFSKYAAEYAALSFWDRRKARASHYLALANNCARARSPKAITYVLCSLLQCPSGEAMRRLLRQAGRVLRRAMARGRSQG
jgi:glycosyltransferase involved in cell wall biosynthesis